MKKIAISILALFLSLALLDGMLKTPWAKQKALDILTKSIEGSGWDIQVEKVQSAFPKIHVENVTIQNDTFALTFGSIRADLSLIHLLKSQVFFSQVQGDRVSWEIKEGAGKSPEEETSPSFTLNVHDFAFSNVEIFSGFQANVQGSFYLKNRRNALKIRTRGQIDPLFENPILAKTWNFSMQGEETSKSPFFISKLKLANDDITIEGGGDFGKGSLTKASFQARSNTISLQSLPSRLRLLAQIDIDGKEEGILSSIHFRFPSLQVEGYSLSNASGKIEALYHDKSFGGNVDFTTHFLEATWKGTSSFSWGKEKPLSFSLIQIESPLLKSSGNIDIGPKENLTGSLVFATEQMNAFLQPLYGKASGKIVFLSPSQVQFDANISNFYYKSFSAESIGIYSDLTFEEKPPYFDSQTSFTTLSLPGRFGGVLLCDIQNGEWASSTFSSLSFETTKERESWMFEISALGTLKHPLEASLSGYWNCLPDNLMISLQDANGSFFDHPFFLASPSYFEWTPSTLQWRDFSLHFADGSIDFFFQKENQKLQSKLAIHQVPIDVLSVNPLDVGILGTFDMDLEVEEIKDKMKGHFQANADQVEMHLLGQSAPIRAEGRFSGNFDRDTLFLGGSLKVQESSLFELNLSLPIHLEIWPPKADLIYDKQMKGKLVLKGKAEEFLDFINLGTHRIEGNCLCDLSISHTLSHPLSFGTCSLTDGYYQNYYTGTELQHINADFVADGNTLKLTSLTAQDSQNKGLFNAQGAIKLLPKEKFPYVFDLHLDRFNVSTLDFITTEMGGALQITGNLEEGLAKGHLEMIESDINIPSRIPRSLPDLTVVYKNAEKPQQPSESPKTPSYPLHLDISVDAPDGIFISGRGLDSEWKGQFLVKGTQTDIATQGKIELIKGKFSFSGREFKLTEGSLVFSGEKNEMPFLNLGANIEIKDISVTAHLTGPLNNPQVVLNSSPPLPMGTIMAYLLFGQDLTEINSFQALQLANSIANLAGQSPGILEQTRKSIGVDRIEIITVPSAAAEGGETIAIQVGKYVAEGVLVSFSQGAEENSSNIKIEIDGKGGVSFLLESDQSQEQGKFTIRWSHTY